MDCTQLTLETGTAKQKLEAVTEEIDTRLYDSKFKFDVLAKRQNKFENDLTTNKEETLNLIKQFKHDMVKCIDNGFQTNKALRIYNKLDISFIFHKSAL